MQNIDELPSFILFQHMKIDLPASLSPRRKAHFSYPPSASPQSTALPRWTLALAGILVAATLAGCSKSEAEQKAAPKPEPQVGVVTLQAQHQQLDVSLPGRTRAFLTAEVRPQVSGIIQKRLFTEGTQVKQGQQLYQIDAASLKAAEASAAAAVAKAEASQRTQAATARRNAELVKIDAISKQAFDESQAAAAQAQSDVAVAKANLETARINLKYARIEAPIGGRIALSTVTPGALVTANQTNALTTIVQLDPIYVDFTQSSSDLMQLKRDLDSGRLQKVEGNKVPVRIVLDDGSEYPQQGRLEFAGVIVNDTTGTLTLRAQVPNPDGMLMPGMYVQAKLPTALAPDALLVPQQSVTRDLAGNPNVMVVKQGEVAEKRQVELDRAVGAFWLLKSGLKSGERVMVDGFQRIKPGDKVKAVEVDLKARAERKSVRGEPPVQAAADAPAAVAK